MSVPHIFDRAALAAARRKSLRSEPGFLLPHLAAEAAERLQTVKRDFALTLDLGTPGEALAETLATLPQIGEVIRLEAEPSALRPGTPSVAAHPDLLPFAEGSLDLVVSLLSLGAVDDLPGALLQIRRALKPDGLFLAAVFAEGTLAELRDVLGRAEIETEGGVSPRVAPFPDVRALGALLQRAGFALPVVDADRLTVRYREPFRLLADLRAEALSNPLAARRRGLRRDTLFRALELYREDHADPDGKVRASFEIAWISGWAPAPTQQQPLKPGSARMRLADALGAIETPLGEKP